MLRSVIGYRWTLVMAFIASSIMYSCSPGPKVISLDDARQAVETPHPEIPTIQQGQHGASQEDLMLSDDIRIVKIIETLPTEKYIYAFVNEDDKNYWIASEKVTLDLNKNYYYKGRMTQIDFYSREYDRTFDTVYFVSQIIPADHNLSNQGRLKNDLNDHPETELYVKEAIQIPGSISIAELVTNKESYGGQTIQISGRCVKVNTDIMDRNWVHIQDGTQNDFDMVITTGETVKVGETITFSGVVVLDQNYGSGYFYPIIIEEGQIKDGLNTTQI